jgi:hypothetical protein
MKQGKNENKEKEKWNKKLKESPTPKIKKTTRTNPKWTKDYVVVIQLFWKIKWMRTVLYFDETKDFYQFVLL